VTPSAPVGAMSLNRLYTYSGHALLICPMRLALSVLLTAAASSAATYTNTFGTSDPALVFLTDTAGARAWNPEVAYNYNTSDILKNWDVTPSDGSVRVSGWVSLPQSYIDTYPATAGFGSAGFTASTQIAGLASFKVGDVGQISFQVGANAGNTAPVRPSLSLVSASGSYNYFIHAGNATYSVSRTGPGDTGDYIYTYSNIVLTNQYQNPDAPTFLADDLYTGVQFISSADFNFFPTFSVVRDQFADLTFHYVSINTAGAPPVPEASTYGLALGGLALAGALIRRRSKRA